MRGANQALNQLQQYKKLCCCVCGRTYPQTILNIEGVIHHGKRPECVDVFSCLKTATKIKKNKKKNKKNRK